MLFTREGHASGGLGTYSQSLTPLLAANFHVVYGQRGMLGIMSDSETAAPPGGMIREVMRAVFSQVEGDHV